MYINHTLCMHRNHNDMYDWLALAQGEPKGLAGEVDWKQAELPGSVGYDQWSGGQ